MYPETTAIIRKAIKRRYELIPYVYSLALESHMTASPPQRWTGWGFESDPEVWTNRVLKDGETQYWLGDALLVGGVYEPGKSEAEMYLPKSDPKAKELFLNTNAPYQYLEAGQWVKIESKWEDSIPVLARVGTAVQIGRPCQTLSTGEANENHASLPVDDYRAVEIFPGPSTSSGKSYENKWYEDDGIAPNEDGISTFSVTYSWSSSEIQVTFSEALQGSYIPPWQTLCIILPVGDKRSVSLGGQAMQSRGADEQGRRIFESAPLRSSASESKSVSNSSKL